MKALLTGATGFVGGHLVSALLRRGVTVSALVRSPARAREIEAAGVRLVPGDLASDAALEQAVREQDVVYHVAGLVAARNEAEFLLVNREGTRRLLDAAAKAGAKRFVLVSSLAAAGPSEPGRPLQGGEPERPVTAYGRSKLAGEEVVRGGPLPWTILRPPAVYGPGDREMLRVFRIARSGIAPVFGGGTQQLSMVFGPDLGEALAAAGHAPAAEGKVYYPAHPEIVTSGDVVRTIGRAVGREVKLLPLPAVVARGVLAATGFAARLADRSTLLNPDKANEFLQAAWTADPAALTRDTGWRAEYDLAGGVKVTLDWYRGAGWL